MFRSQKKKNYEIEKKKIKIEKKYFGIQKNFSELRILCNKSLQKILKSMTSNSMNLPGNFYLFKVNNRNTKKQCEICSKIMIKTLE